MLAVFLLLLVSGILFYIHVEGWSVLDALYFSIATLSTVGYGDFAPQTSLGKVFTIIYLLVGVGVFMPLGQSPSDVSFSVLNRKLPPRT